MTEPVNAEIGREAAIDSLVNDVFERITLLHAKRSSDELPTISGFMHLNEVINDSGGEFFAAVVGAPGIGRTVVMNQMFLEAKRPGHRLFFSIDLSPALLITRWLGASARVDNGRVPHGLLNERDFERLAKAAGALAEMDISVVDAYDLAVDDMLDHAREVARSKSVGVIAVDGLELLVGEDLDSAILKLRRLSRELRCAVLLTLPVDTRLLNQRVNKRPSLSDLTVSSVAESAADLVIGVYRDEFYNRETDNQGIMELLVMKQKHGSRGTVRVLFHSAHLRLIDFAPEGV